VNSSDEEEDEPDYTPRSKNSNKNKVEKKSLPNHVEHSSSEEEEESSSEESSSSEEEGEEQEGEEEEEKMGKKSSKSKFSNINSQVEKEWKTVEVTFHVGGSPSEFSRNPELAVMNIKGDPSKIFGGKNHILKETRLKKIKNDYGIALQLVAKGIDIDSNVFTASGTNEGAIYTALPNEKNFKLDKVVIQGNALGKNNAFLKKYPSVNLSNVADAVEFPKNNPNTALVSVKSPVWDIFINEMKQSKKKFNQKISGEYGSMHIDQAKKALRDVEQILQDEIQVRDLSKLSFEIKRAFTNPKVKHEIGEEWTDHTEIKDTHSNPKNALDQKGSLFATFEFVYRNV
jgi:hypothetical protein